VRDGGALRCVSAGRRQAAARVMIDYEHKLVDGGHASGACVRPGLAPSLWRRRAGRWQTGSVSKSSRNRVGGLLRLCRGAALGLRTELDGGARKSAQERACAQGAQQQCAVRTRSVVAAGGARCGPRAGHNDSTSCLQNFSHPRQPGLCRSADKKLRADCFQQCAQWAVQRTPRTRVGVVAGRRLATVSYRSYACRGYACCTGSCLGIEPKSRHVQCQLDAVVPHPDR